VSAELDASFGVQLETGNGDEDADGARRRYRFVARRRLYRNGAAQSDGANPCIISLGHPPIGRFWEVNVVAVTTSTPQTQVAAASWALFVGARVPQANQAPDLSACIWPAFGNTVPGKENWGANQITVVGGEHLYVVVFAGAATSYTANMMGWDRDEAELTDSSILPIPGDLR